MTSRLTAVSKKICFLNYMEKYGKGQYKIQCGAGCPTMIDPFTFEAGHIESVANGGPNTFDNLIPICSTCNKSMGKENMIDFILKQGYTTEWVIDRIKNASNKFEINKKGFIYSNRYAKYYNFEYQFDYVLESKNNILIGEKMFVEHWNKSDFIIDLSSFKLVSNSNICKLDSIDFKENELVINKPTFAIFHNLVIDPANLNYIKIGTLNNNRIYSDPTKLLIESIRFYRNENYKTLIDMCNYKDEFVILRLYVFLIESKLVSNQLCCRYEKYKLKLPEVFINENNYVNLDSLIDIYNNNKKPFRLLFGSRNFINVNYLIQLKMKYF